MFVDPPFELPADPAALTGPVLIEQPVLNEIWAKTRAGRAWHRVSEIAPAQPHPSISWAGRWLSFRCGGGSHERDWDQKRAIPIEAARTMAGPAPDPLQCRSCRSLLCLDARP